MRPTVDETMLEVALILARRATCEKLAVGCVLTDKNNVIVGTGYNGVPRGCVHCTDVPCPGAGTAKGSDLCEAVHAETNALLCPAASTAVTCYVTHAPCLRCVKTLLNTGITAIIFVIGDHIEVAAKDLWKRSGREWSHFSID